MRSIGSTAVQRPIRGLSANRRRANDTPTATLGSQLSRNCHKERVDEACPRIGGIVIEHGVLALIVGPSGVGKDSLVASARTALSGNPAFSFPSRVITRPVSVGPETHTCLTKSQFEMAEKRGAFLLSWRAHETAYGIPRTIVDDLEQGRIVVANISRTVVAAACALVRSTVVFHVTAPREIIQQRLASRGREAPAAIGQRLERAPRMPSTSATVLEIDNSGPLSGAATRFIDELLRLAASQAGSVR